MSDTIESPPPDPPPYDTADGMPQERPATAQALAAWSVDFEHKFFSQQASDHSEQMAAIRAGQTAMLRSFEETVAAAIARFDTEFARALQELQAKTHSTANAVDKLVRELAERHAEQEQRDKLVEQRLLEIERWKLETIKTEHPEPPLEPSPRSRS